MKDKSNKNKPVTVKCVYQSIEEDAVTPSMIIKESFYHFLTREINSIHLVRPSL